MPATPLFDFNIQVFLVATMVVSACGIFFTIYQFTFVNAYRGRRATLISFKALLCVSFLVISSILSAFNGVFYWPIKSGQIVRFNDLRQCPTIDDLSIDRIGRCKLVIDEKFEEYGLFQRSYDGDEYKIISTTRHDKDSEILIVKAMPIFSKNNDGVFYSEVIIGSDIFPFQDYSLIFPENYLDLITTARLRFFEDNVYRSIFTMTVALFLILLPVFFGSEIIKICGIRKTVLETTPKMN